METTTLEPTDMAETMASTHKTALRILMVEDLPHWQEAIRSLLETIPEASIVSITDEYHDALASYDTLMASADPNQHPNVALLDFQILGEKTGLDVAHALHQRGIKAECIVMVSSSPTSVIGPHPFSYVPKSRVFEELPVVLAGIAQVVA